MTACSHRRLDDPSGLLCDRHAPHDPLARGGHTYTGSNASHLGEGAHHREPAGDDQ